MEGIGIEIKKKEKGIRDVRCFCRQKKVRVMRRPISDDSSDVNITDGDSWTSTTVSVDHRIYSGFVGCWFSSSLLCLSGFAPSRSVLLFCCS